MNTFILKYTETLIRGILTGNQLGRVTGNETVNVFITLVICLGAQLAFIAAVPTYIYAHVYHPVPKNIAYLVLVICGIISFCIVGVVYEKGVIKRLIEEDRMRRRALLPRFMFTHALFPVYCFLLALLLGALLK